MTTDLVKIHPSASCCLTNVVHSDDLCTILGMEHRNLVRSIKRILEDCPESERLLTCEQGCRKTKGGDFVFYQITERGLLLLLPRLGNKKSKEITWKIISNLSERVIKLKEEIAKKSPKQIAMTPGGEMVKNKYGTRWSPKVPMKDKKILVVPESQELLNFEEGGYHDANQMSQSELMQCIISLDRSKMHGIEKALSKKKEYLEALHKWESGEGEKPAFRKYGIKTEYDCFFLEV